MKVLVVCSYRTNSSSTNYISPFIFEQVESLKHLCVEIDFYLIKRKGIWGYLKERKGLIEKISEFQPHLIHAHFGLSGLLANLQRKVPVVTTYHGSDINNNGIFPFSVLSILLSKWNIFVSEKNMKKGCFQFYSNHSTMNGIQKASNITAKSSIIPCGINTKLFFSINSLEARKLVGLDIEKKYVLFAGAFNNQVKNYELANEALLDVSGVTLLELKGYTRLQVMWLMNAVDVVLMTSHTEGSPQFIKEAMACNCPIVSVPVGDVPELIDGVEGCYISTYDAVSVKENVIKALEYGKRTEARKIIVDRKLGLDEIAVRVYDVWRRVIDE